MCAAAISNPDPRPVRYRTECALYDEIIQEYAQCRYCLNCYHMVAGKFYIADYRGSFCGEYVYPREKPSGVRDGSEKCAFFERNLRM